MNYYKVLDKPIFTSGNYSLVPLRHEDRYDIMKWRNEQVYHLRQNKLLTKANQDHYFTKVVAKLFEQDQPEQLLFSYLENEVCIGYGGLVHINWADQNAEISFIIDTSLEKENFEKHWTTYLELLEQVAFEELEMHKIYTYAFDLRPHLYDVLEKNGFSQDAVLKEHCFHDGKYIDVKIHCKTDIYLRKAEDKDVDITYAWAKNPKVRQYSFNQTEIDRNTHKNWFQSKLDSARCFYYLLIEESEPVGSIRFDVEGTEAVISYLLDPEYHGRGLGKKLVKKGIKQLLRDNENITIITGYVMPENQASIKIFQSLGFKEESKTTSKIRYINRQPTANRQPPIANR